jgi:hypothetical protein
MFGRRDEALQARFNAVLDLLSTEIAKKIIGLARMKDAGMRDLSDYEYVSPLTKDRAEFLLRAVILRDDAMIQRASTKITAWGADNRIDDKHVKSLVAEIEGAWSTVLEREGWRNATFSDSGRRIER